MRRLLAVGLLATGLAAPARATLPCTTVPGVSDRCETWVSTAKDVVTYTQIAVAGGMAYAVGTDTRGRFTVEAYDTAHGTVRWVGHPPTDLPTRGIAVAVSPDGKAVYATGTLSLRPNLNSNPFTYFLTMRFEAKTGRPLWSALYKGVGANDSAVTAITLSPRGDRVYVTGWSARLCSCQVLPHDWATLGYDARTGRQQWVARYAGVAGGRNEAVGLAVSPRGDRVYVTGASEHPTQNTAAVFDVATIAYSASRGTLRWSKRTPGYPLALALRGDHVWVAGTSGVVSYAGTSGGALHALALPAVPMGFAVSPDEQRVYVSGVTAGQAVTGAAAVSAGIAVTAYDVKTARQAWSVPYAPAGATLTTPTALAVSASGAKVYVTGYTGPTFETTYPFVVCVSRAGAQSWVARYDVRDPVSATTPLGVGLAVARDGRRVYVNASGTAEPIAGPAYGLLLAYEG